MTGVVRPSAPVLVEETPPDLGSARHRQFKSIGMRTILWIAYLVLIVVVWWAIVRLGHFKSYLFPSPLDVWRAGKAYPRLIASSCWVTLYEALVGFALALASGLLLAVIVVFVPPIRQIVLPTVIGLNTLPKVAIAPIVVVFLGLGVTSKVAMALALAFFPIFINEVGGLNDVDRSLMEYLDLLQATRIQRLIYARVPSSLPVLFDGMKIGLSLSIVGALVGEFIAASKGLGYEITIAYSTLNTPLVWALVIVVSIAAALLYFVLLVVERGVMWRFPSRRQRA